MKPSGIMVLSIQREKEMHAMLEKLEKATGNQNEKSIESKKTSEKAEEHKQSHNSLQHEPTVSVPLLSLLVDALKKENKDDDEEKDGLEIIAEEVEDTDWNRKKKDAKKDAIVALANRIKRMYAQELQDAYANTMQGYNPNAQYQNDRVVQMSNMIIPPYEQEEYNNPEKLKPKEIKDENSTYNKLAGGGKYQAFIMTDPRGRLHGRWDIERVMNETGDGKLERNDGLHYQGLS